MLTKPCRLSHIPHYLSRWLGYRRLSAQLPPTRTSLGDEILVQYAYKLENCQGGVEHYSRARDKNHDSYLVVRMDGLELYVKNSDSKHRDFL
jgi:hypothetical protein